MLDENLFGMDMAELLKTRQSKIKEVKRLLRVSRRLIDENNQILYPCPIDTRFFTMKIIEKNKDALTRNFKSYGTTWSDEDLITYCTIKATADLQSNPLTASVSKKGKDLAKRVIKTVTTLEKTLKTKKISMYQLNNGHLTSF